MLEEPFLQDQRLFIKDKFAGKDADPDADA